MSAADDQADAGEDVASGRQASGVDVALDVIDADQRHVQAHREHLGGADADQQSADQPRRIVDGDAADVFEAYRRLLQRLVDDRQQTLQMGAGGDLRHDAAEAGVQIGLRGDDAGENHQLVGEDGRRRFVTGGFDGQEVQRTNHRGTETQRKQQTVKNQRSSSVHGLFAFLFFLFSL